MANTWFRMYHEFATDPKVQCMSESMQRRLVMLFCLRSGDVLVTLQEQDIAFALRVTEHELAETKDVFIRKGFIDADWNLLNWDKRQFVSDSSTERTRAYRERMRTSPKRHGDAPDTDTDTDSEKKQKKSNGAAAPEVNARTVVETVKAAAAKNAANSRGTRLSIEHLPIEWEGWTRDTLGWTHQRCAEVFEIFHDFWCAKSGKDATKIEWFLTWKNWCKNQRTAPPASNGNQNGAGGYKPGKEIRVERPTD